MATPQLSPGVLTREVDLTVGRADNVLDNIGAIAGPFSIGPVEQPVDISTEQELINIFGKPQESDSQYEYWMSASSFLSYGGVLKVVRVSGNSLNNANAGLNEASNSSLNIKNFDNYEAYHSSDSASWTFAAKNPGSWANNLKVCVIDDLADQTIGISTNDLGNIGANIGFGVTVPLSSITAAGDGTTSVFNGYLKGIITGINTAAIDANTSSIDVRVVSRVSDASTSYDEVLSTQASQEVTGNVGIKTFYVDSVSGITTSSLVTISGVFSRSAIAGVGTTSITMSAGIGTTISSGVAVLFENLISVAGTETYISYSEKNQFSSFLPTNQLTFVNNSGINTGAGSYSVASVTDWYSNQTLNLSNSTLYWKSLAPKPLTTQYALNRNSKNDAIHVVVVDDTGSVTGISGNVLETHLNLSKATDAISASNSPQRTFWKDYLARYSSYIYAGNNPSDSADTHWGTTPVETGFAGKSFRAFTGSSSNWDQNAQDVTFKALGNKSYTLTGGVDYSSSGGMGASLSDLRTAYELFSNRDEVPLDYLIMGPGLQSKIESKAKASHLISMASNRKDCVAVISPHRSDLITGTVSQSPILNTNTQTDNVIQFFSDLPSSSYAIFDSGYKYTYDRFNNKFRYIPCNSDVAGMMCRTNLTSYPWFSPAGQQRGILNNAIKLAFNPNKDQRDRLYSTRVNSIITQPGVGTLLFGDKTALGYASAFDRINVRRLFLTIEQALQRSSEALLFELNDQTTRSNFVNIVEPYLRDVQAKRGLYDYIVICDETNNTPDVIDNNEFRADIFLKPTKSINYVTLTFVATRTGVSFEEVAGSV